MLVGNVVTLVIFVMLKDGFVVRELPIGEGVLDVEEYSSFLTENEVDLSRGMLVVEDDKVVTDIFLVGHAVVDGILTP